ncbi:MAG: PilW family protein [Proteobacteria bacterium]|nr:PilW family protein [Pseudomonadota bacterium]
MHSVKTRGFSLVELLLALGLGLVITAGIVQLFVGNDRTQSILVGQSRLQEGARYAFDFIGRSVRSSGYFGCAPEPDRLYNTLNGSWDEVFEADITTPIEAFDYTGGGGTSRADWTPSWVDGNRFVDGDGIDSDDIAPGTDILVVRRIESPGHSIDALTAPEADPVTLRVDGALTIGQDDFAVIANCEQAAVFRVQDVVLNGNEATLNRGATKGKFGNSGNPLSETGLSYGNVVNSQGSTVGRVVTDIYYIGPGAGVDNRGAPVLALWRRSGIDAAIELVEGVTDLQILFGVDTDATDNLATINQYMDFDSIGLNHVIRTVRIEITSSSVDVLADATAPALRTFSQTINLRNAS